MDTSSGQSIAVNASATPTLDELRRELETIGMVVVPFGDEIHIRRSTLEYIKVRVDNGVLRCKPYIGFLSQGSATWLLLAFELIGVPQMIVRHGMTANALVAAFAGLLAFGVHTLRYVLADITVSQTQSVWRDLRSRIGLAGQRTTPSLPSATTPALQPGEVRVHQEIDSHRVRTPR